MMRTTPVASHSPSAEAAVLGDVQDNAQTLPVRPVAAVLRIRGVRRGAIPDELKALPQWVGWRLEERAGEAGSGAKRTKVPYVARLGAPSGTHAKVDDPTTWAPFNEALARSGDFDGLGFVLTANDPFVGVDLDGCRDAATSDLEPWARVIVDALDSYTDVTPSATGLRIFVRGHLPPGGRHRGKVEMYDRGRFLTVTGHHLGGTPTQINDRTDALAALHARIFGASRPTTNFEPPPAGTVLLADEELLDRACRAANGERFAQLWSGDRSRYGGDDSAADQALANLLAFWTGRDAERMDRLFRQSGLRRSKWDERRGDRTYGQLTIERAIEGCQDVYEPGKPPATVRDRGTNVSRSPRVTAAGTDDDLHERLSHLYGGRFDVLAWNGDPAAKRKKNFGNFLGHLQGRELGIYPLTDSGLCRWASAVVVGDVERALQLQRLLRDHELTALVLRERDEADVTLFFHDWAEAADVRRIFAHLMAEAALPPSTMIVPTLDRPQKANVGGFRRPPYRGALYGRSTCAALDPDDPRRVLRLQEFLDTAEACRVSPDLVRAVAAEFVGGSATAEARTRRRTVLGEASRSSIVGSEGPVAAETVTADQLLALHARMLDARLAPGAWPIVSEIARTTDLRGGWSVSPVEKLVDATIGLGRSTVYDLLSQLVAHRILEHRRVPGTHGRWPRAAFRLATPSAREVARVRPSLVEVSQTSEPPQRDCGKTEESSRPDSVDKKGHLHAGLNRTESSSPDTVTDSTGLDTVK
jgi:hypothetical protein